MVPLPLLDEPLRAWFCSLHSIINLLVCSLILFFGTTLNAATLVEWIHRVVLALAHHLFETSIVIGSNLGKTCIRRQHNLWTCKATPCIGVTYHTCLLLEIAWHHSAETGQHRLHSKSTLTVENLLCKVRLAFIPGIVLHTTPTGGVSATPTSRFCTTPALEVVHCPPGSEGRTGNKGFGLSCRIVVLHKELAPNLLETHNLQWHIHTVQSHPVNLLLPTFPIPGTH